MTGRGPFRTPSRRSLRRAQAEGLSTTTGDCTPRPEGEIRCEVPECHPHAVAVFVESFAPPPRMLIFGAVDFTAALARVAKVLGYEVLDFVRENGPGATASEWLELDLRCATPGSVFADTSKRRFPMADEVVVSWPDRLLAEIGTGLGPRDAVCASNKRLVEDITASPISRKSTLRQVRRARHHFGADHRRRLHRGDGEPPHPRRPHRPPDRGRGDFIGTTAHAAIPLKHLLMRLRRIDIWPELRSPIGLSTDSGDGHPRDASRGDGGRASIVSPRDHLAAHLGSRKAEGLSTTTGQFETERARARRW